jgi:myb proto-oncogene protein
MVAMTPKSNNTTLGGPQSDGSTGSSVGTGGGAEGGGVALKKGPWTAVEDAILTEYVRKHGEGNWNSVQRNTGLARCGKSCRLRWANHLRPNLKKGAFAPEEERLILELHAKYGNKWARMAAQVHFYTYIYICETCLFNFQHELFIFCFFLFFPLAIRF